MSSQNCMDMPSHMSSIYTSSRQGGLGTPWVSLGFRSSLCSHPRQGPVHKGKNKGRWARKTAVSLREWEENHPLLSFESTWWGLQSYDLISTSQVLECKTNFQVFTKFFFSLSKAFRTIAYRHARSYFKSKSLKLNDFCHPNYCNSFPPEIMDTSEWEGKGTNLSKYKAQTCALERAHTHTHIYISLCTKSIQCFNFKKWGLDEHSE